MSLFSRSLNRFTGASTETGPPEQNITYRKKLSTVSTSLKGDDGPVAESPRNLYTRQNLVPLRRKVFDEPDGAVMSTSSGQTPVELKAAEIRRNNSKKETSWKREENNAPPPIPIEGTSDTVAPQSLKTNQKKSRTSTSSLASVFRSRASSPIERMRKFIGRSSSKQPKEISAPLTPTTSNDQAVVPKDLILLQELEKVRCQLAQTQIQLTEQNKKLKSAQMVSCSQQSEQIVKVNIGTMTDEVTDGTGMKPSNLDKENTNPDVICIEDSSINSSKIQSLKHELAVLKKENADQVEDFRRTRKDFILILKEAVLRKDEAEHKLEAISNSISDEDDWVSLMSQHKHTLRRNVLLMWAQKILEPYSDQLAVSNFSSDWTDCRAFCALLYDLFPETMPDVTISPIVGDCIARCRRTFQLLEIPFDERALGIVASPSPLTDSGADDSSSASSVITGLTDWRYIMNTVFILYKRGVLGK